MTARLLPPAAPRLKTRPLTRQLTRFRRFPTGPNVPWPPPRRAAPLAAARPKSYDARLGRPRGRRATPGRRGFPATQPAAPCSCRRQEFPAAGNGVAADFRLRVCWCAALGDATRLRGAAGRGARSTLALARRAAGFHGPWTTEPRERVCGGAARWLAPALRLIMSGRAARAPRRRRPRRTGWTMS